MRVGVLIADPFPSDFAERVAAGEHPRSELFDLANRVRGQLIYLTAATGLANLIFRTLRRFSSEIALALYASQRRREFDIVYVGNERVGLLLALLFKTVKRRPRMVMLVQNLSNSKKYAIFVFFKLQSCVDTFLCINEYQANFLEEKLGVPNRKIFRLNYGACVDGSFFRPSERKSQDRPRYIFSIGRENRDYDTLVRAVENYSVDLKILTGGLRDPKQRNDIVQRAANNVEIIVSARYEELRELYAGCEFVVIPLSISVDYPAGITGIIEAMSMAKPVIATYSRGIREYVQDSVTGFWVDAGDVSQMREKVILLWNNPDLARAMGIRAREWVRTRVDMDRYVDELASFLGSFDLRSPG